MHDHKRLFREPRHPYYVVAPNYRSNSAGIRVMHLLCHALRQAGEEAWMVTEETNPELNTPILSEKTRTWHESRNLTPIAIYPEIIGSNPLNCEVVVRYILNRPGLLGEKPAYSDQDIFFAYVPELLNHTPSAAEVLFLPPINTAIFHNNDNPHDNARKGACVYYGRYTLGPKNHPDLAANCTVITSDWPATPEEMAQLLRRSEYLYCFENTSLATEARLCGCPAVTLPSPYFDKNVLFGRSMGFDQGIAFSLNPAELEHAKQTVGAIEPLYKALEASFWTGLDKLIEMTQARANATPQRQMRVEPPTSHSSSRHPAWIATQTPSDADAQILAERMVLHWKQRPGVHLLMAVRQGENNLMADTLDSLGDQLYPDWRLTVVSDLPAPEGWQELPNLQWLALRDAVHIEYVINEMAAASPADWITRIAPGVMLAPQALLLIADHLQRHPDWCLVYTDEDTLQTKGVHAQPRFKPDFNLEYLRANNYLGSLVLIRKDAFLTTGCYGQHVGAQDYDLALRIVDSAGALAIGHVPRMLVHVNAQTQHARSLVAESLALNDHLRRHGMTATVHDGLQPDTRRLHYEWSQPPQISLVLAVQDELEFVHPLLDELKTLPGAEVLLMDVGSSDPDIRSFLDEQKAQPDWQGRLKVLNTTETTWPQTAASAASGEFLFFLDNHATAPKAADLATMEALAQCPGTGAVAPRLVQATPNGLVMNGDWSLAGHNRVEPAQHHPGPLGLGLCAHNKLAISRLPLLVRKSAFMEAGGLDLASFTLSDAVTNLCIHLAQAGHALIWTPHATLSHLTSEGCTAPNPKTETQNRSSRLLLERHLQAFAAGDPTRHPLWSLERPDQLDHHVPVAWTDKPGEKPRILLLVTDGEPAQETGFYKAVARWQRDAEVLLTVVDLRTQSLSPLSVAKWMPDAFVLHATTATPVQTLLEEVACMLPQVQRIVRLDSLDFLPTRQGANVADARPMLRKLLRHASKVVVPTQELAALCEGLVDEVMVHQSLHALSARDWLHVPISHRSGTSVTIPTTVS